MIDPSFWQGRRVLLTGHTGFKGAWAAQWLARMGAQVSAVALPVGTDPSLWSLVRDVTPVSAVEGDIRDRDMLARVVDDAEPEIVLHLAAHTLVFFSYREPLETFSSNVIGTATLLDQLRARSGLSAILVVTSDKVYVNDEREEPYREHEPLGGDDPYSASKAAQEMVAHSYRESYFAPRGVPLVTARAGNVIGGGDWAANRLIPDLWRSCRRGEPLELRHPHARRPWQHVLDCLHGYFTYVERIVGADDRSSLPLALNLGPEPGRDMSVGHLADAVAKALGHEHGWVQASGTFPAEKSRLDLDNRLAASSIGWHPVLGMDATAAWTAEWYREFDAGADAARLCTTQIDRFMELAARAG